MLTHSLFRHLLCDTWSLQMYRQGEAVSLDDIKRHLMLIEREYDVHIPDHYYRLAQKKTFESIDTKSKIFTQGLVGLADEYLEVHSQQVFVKAERFNEWQLLLPCMPPLLLVAAKLWACFGFDTEHCITYLRDYVMPNTHYTALQRPHIRQLEDMKSRNRGMRDLHIHLNGSLEADRVWQDFLFRPDVVFKDLQNSFRETKAKELYLQLSPLTQPTEFHSLLHIAACLRQQICLFIQGKSLTNKCKSDFQQLMAGGLLPIVEQIHPFTEIVGITGCEPMQTECLMYISVLKELAAKQSDWLADTFHFYLMILGLANRMLVQQTKCNGFEEFQKYTMNGLRETSEKRYLRRFLQMAGNELDQVRFVEGRFSPKETLSGNQELIARIEEGWKRLLEKLPSPPNPKLKLIAHFIKKPDNKPDSFIRHKMLRWDVKQRAKVLALMKRNGDPYAKRIVGIDAAASEFDAPPEVFAPAFRKLRAAGYEHFTFHAGEDFYHILSGLRFIYEAVEFLGLRRGDRIGHATASGISVPLWRENVGERIWMYRGEYLDDLIFTRYLITSQRIAALYDRLPLLNDRIDNLSTEVYGEYHSPDMLQHAWSIRYEDPESFLNGKKTLSWKEKLFLRYHEREVVDKYNAIEPVETYELLGEEDLQLLQLALLAFLHEREIVIETLPTSNVIIGHHRSFDTYHLYNWWRWKSEGHPVPPIVVGTDDTGIFATNIYNEYCNIYCQLLYGKKMNSTEIMRFIEELDYNARLYQFQN